MAKAPKIYTVGGDLPYFSPDGVLCAPGSLVADEVSDPGDNLSAAPKGAQPTLQEAEVASLAPTGQNPTAPQAVPAGTTQIGNAFVQDGNAGSDPQSFVAEGSTDKK